MTRAVKMLASQILPERAGSAADAPESEMVWSKVPELLKRYRALVELQENLSRNIQEALAIEVAFIEAFGPAAQK